MFSHKLVPLGDQAKKGVIKLRSIHRRATGRIEDLVNVSNSEQVFDLCKKKLEVKKPQYAQYSEESCSDCMVTCSYRGDTPWLEAKG